MALQKRRLGKHRVHSRRSAWMGSLGTPTLQKCPECDAPKVPHRVCIKCGKYNGREVLEPQADDE